jgi:hypothetical protein
MLVNVGLDDQVDAQPLFVPGLTIAGGTHDVVYVATEHNTIYAIDASSGTILKSTNLDLMFHIRLDVAIMGRVWESPPPPSSMLPQKRYTLSPV